MTSLTAENDVSEAVKVATTLVAAANQNCELLKSLPGHIQGVNALIHRIHKERNVLIKGCERPRWLKLEHVISSNLYHLGAVVQLAAALSDKVDAVLKKYRDNVMDLPVFVDVVANGGLLWMKVLCRCPNTLQLAHCTGGRAGERSPLDQARSLLSLVQQYPILYSTPKVAFIFCKGVSQAVFDALRREGVIVCTPFVLPDSALPASRYLPHDGDDETLSLASDGSIDSDFKAAFTSYSNGGAPSQDSDLILFGDSHEVKKSLPENYNLNNDVVVDARVSSNCNDDNRKENECGARLGGSLNDAGFNNFQEKNKLGGLDLTSDYHKNSTSKLEEKIIDASHIAENGVQNSTARIDFNEIVHQRCFFEDGIVLKSPDELLLDSRHTSSKKQWPLCSEDEIVEIARALKNYTSKSDWASKAKKSQTYVSLCQNSHYIGSQFGSHDVTDVSSCHETKTTPDNLLRYCPREHSEGASASQMREAEPLKSLEKDVENFSDSQSLVKEVNVSLSTDSRPPSNCDLPESNSTNTFSKTNSANALVGQNVDLPFISIENLITSGADKLKKPTNFSERKINATAALNVTKLNTLRRALPPVESLQDNETVAARRLVCLDVPTMIAYIANTSNGFSHCQFEDTFLRQQALWEQEEPIKPVIEKYWQDCEVLVCREALKRFESIVGVMAGEQEMLRARELVSCVTIIPDSDELKGVLQACGGITVSSRIIFGTALHHKAPLITANRRFVRSAHTQGLSVAALLHNPRALTEQKQLLAVGCDTPLGGADSPPDSLSVPPHNASTPDPSAVQNKSHKKTGVGKKPTGDPRKQVLSCLSSARYLSTVTPVSLLSSN